MAEEGQKQEAPTPLKEPIDRRKFVKTSLKFAAGGAILAGTAPYVVPLSYSTRKIKRFPYIGAKIAGGPAPQGVPLIPVRVNDQGELEGIPEAKSKTVNHSLEWYRYCSHEEAPGLKPDFTDDNVLRYYTLPDKIVKAKGQGFNVWFENLLDQRVRAEHFQKIGDGAPFRWRSEGQEQNNIVTGIVIRIDPSKVRGKIPDGFIHHVSDTDGFLAVCSFCAHFCCVPGYLENDNPKAHMAGRGINDTVIYCSCHDSQYDFMELKEYTFPPDF